MENVHVAVLLLLGLIFTLQGKSRVVGVLFPPEENTNMEVEVCTGCQSSGELTSVLYVVARLN